MRRPSKYYAELFVRATADVVPQELGALTQSFIALLAKENALARFHEISRLIHVALDHAAGSQTLTVTTAHALAASELESLARSAKAAGFGDVQTKVDPELIGGVLLRAGDRRLDQSVKGALGRLYETLTS